MRPWLIVCLLVLPSPARAQSDTDIAAQAQTAFARGVESKARLLQARKHFADATGAYLDLHQRGVRSPALYRSLGNAAVLADRWPVAIWAYHVGLALDPNDGDMRAHLAYVRGKVLYPPSGQGRPDADPWPNWLHRPTSREIAWALILLIPCFWVAIALYALAGTKRYLWLAIALGLAGALLSGAASCMHHQREVDEQSPLIVLADNADFFRGNATSYPRHPVVPVLPRGLEARQTHRRGNWLKIRLATGETGWVHARHGLIVDP